MKSIQEAVASVQNAFPSIYTKDDVVHLLSSLEIETPKSDVKFSDDLIRDLVESIKDQLRDNGNNLDSDCLDLGSAELSMSYNEVQLDSVDFDSDEIVKTMIDGIETTIATFFENLKTEEEEDCE